MKKRIAIKLHKKYLEDIVLEISQSSLWRKRLFEADYDIKLPISIENVTELPKYIKPRIFKYRLRYYVSKIEGKVDDWDFYYDGGVLFKIEVCKFNHIYAYSFNNSDVVSNGSELIIFHSDYLVTELILRYTN